MKRSHARWTILAPALLAFLCASAAPVHADNYTWVGPNHLGGDGDFNSPYWDKGQGFQGPPGPGDSAFIPSGPILSCSGGGVETLDSEASLGGGMDLTGGFSCTNLGSILLSGSGNLTAGTIGPVSGDSAEDIFVMGASVTAGSAVSPNIDISAGGSVVVNSSVNKGEGSVSDANSVFQVQGALLNFNGGASSGGEIKAQSIGSNNGLSGVLMCDGVGSMLSVSGGGEFDGQGSM